jgi:type IV pilus assembly protein PilP
MTMRKPIFIAVLLPVCIALLAGCSEQPAPPPVSHHPAPKKVAVAPPKAAATAKEKEHPAPPAYVYNPAGKRDPFAALVLVKRAIPQPGELTPLQKYDLNQFRLIGIIVGKGAPRAMVVAPDGKSFILKPGIKIGRNDGMVVDITKDGVQIRERFYDFSGAVRTSMQSIQLPKREGAN